MDWSHFEHLIELTNSGRTEDAIRESGMLLAKATDANEKASLLTGALVLCSRLGRFGEARQTLDQIRQLEISDAEVRLNAEFCEPCLLMDEGKHEEAVLAFASMLQRNRDILGEALFRYLYEDIQSRRALALFGLSRFTEALPILQEAIGFSFEEAVDDQRIHYALGVCCEETNGTEGAKREFFRVVGFNLKNGVEEQARYRLARLHVKAYAFAQARKQLEIILDEHSGPNYAVPCKYIYEQLSHVCTHLGDNPSAKLYMDLASAPPAQERGEET